MLHPTSSHKTTLTLTHLTPQVGFKPGHILVDGNLMRHIWDDYQKALNPAGKHVSSAPDSIEWHKFFRFPESFWFNQERHTSCSTFMTDGISVSFQKERMIHRCIRNLEWDRQQEAAGMLMKKKRTHKPSNKCKAPSVTVASAQSPVHFVRNTDHLHYIDQESIESLKAKHIIGVFTIDGSRKNMFVGMYSPLHQMLEEQCDSANGTHGIIPFHVKVHVSKKKFKTMRHILHAAQVREHMYERKFPNGGHEEWMSPPSLKGSTPEQFQAWRMWSETNDRVNELLTFFALHTFRRLGLESYAAQCQMWPLIQDLIYEQIAAGIMREKQRLISIGQQAEADLLLIPVNPCYGLVQKQKNPLPLIASTDPHMLIALGDGSFRHNSAGHLTMPTGNKMFCELQKLGEYICWIDEFCTSKCCSACGHNTVDAVLEKKPPIPRPSTRKARRLPDATPCQLKHADQHNRLRKEALARAIVKTARAEAAALVASQAAKAAAEAGVVGLVATFLTRQHRRPHEPVTRHDLCRQHKSKVHLPSTDMVANTFASWGVLACVSLQCSNNGRGMRLWCRDTNAVINMLKRTAYWLVHKLVGPAYLLRSASGTNDAIAVAADPLHLPKRSRT